MLSRGVDGEPTAAPMTDEPPPPPPPRAEPPGENTPAAVGILVAAAVVPSVAGAAPGEGSAAHHRGWRGEDHLASLGGLLRDGEELAATGPREEVGKNGLGGLVDRVAPPAPSTGSHVSTRCASATASRFMPLSQCDRTWRRHANRWRQVKSCVTRSSRHRPELSCAYASARQTFPLRVSSRRRRHVIPSLATEGPSRREMTSSKMLRGSSSTYPHPSAPPRSSGERDATDLPASDEGKSECFPRAASRAPRSSDPTRAIQRASPLS